MTQDSSRGLGERAQATQDRIIRKAAGAFRANGLSTTRSHIATVAGVCPGTVIAYFPTRETLVRAVYAEELAVLEQAVESFNTITAGSAKSTLLDFVQKVSETFAGNPILAMTFLPFMPDPWRPRSQKRPVSEGVTFDGLVRIFSNLLKDYWTIIDESFDTQTVNEDAKLLMHAMLSSAANKRTASAIANPVLRAVL